MHVYVSVENGHWWQNEVCKNILTFLLRLVFDEPLDFDLGIYAQQVGLEIKHALI